jgi:tRNA-splicing endonuclease subunit Sen54
VAHLSLPKRGEKDFESHSTNLQLDTLEASRRAMHGVLSWQRTHTQKNHILAQYHPETNTVCVDKVKSQHFQTIGRSKGGKEWLLPEEALFMIERGSLDCRWPVKKEEGDEQKHKTEDGAPMSLQAAYAAFIGYEEGVGGKLTLEMYNVYAGLKRSGYVLFRTGTWDEDRGDLLVQDFNAQDAAKAGPGIFTRFFSEIWRRISQPTYSIAPENLSFGIEATPTSSGLCKSFPRTTAMQHRHSSSRLRPRTRSAYTSTSTEPQVGSARPSAALLISVSVSSTHARRRFPRVHN